MTSPAGAARFADGEGGGGGGVNGRSLVQRGKALGQTNAPKSQVHHDT